MRQGARRGQLEGRRQTGALSASTSSSLPITSCIFPWPSTAPTAFLCSASLRRAQGAVEGACVGRRSAQPRLRSCPGWPWLLEALGSWWALRQICVCERAERCDEEGVSIDTICTHSLSPSIVPISSASPSLHLALHAVVPGCSSPPAPPRSAASQSHKFSLIAVTPGQRMTWDQSSVDLY